MSFTRFAEIGRVALINYGELEGKLCTIVDILDANRALVDGPVNVTGVHRHVVTFRRLNLTDHKINITRGARAAKVSKEWKAADITGKWEASAWAKKIAARATKSASGDFDRFKAMVAHKRVRAVSRGPRARSSEREGEGATRVGQTQTDLTFPSPARRARRCPAR